MIFTLLIARHNSFSFILKSGTYRSICGNTVRAMSSSNEISAGRIAKLEECDNEGIRAASEVLKAGGLVAFPTETVYGLGANALNDLSVKSIFAAKKRPSTDPLIVHILSKADIYALYDFENLPVYMDFRVSKAQILCEFLAETFWPGPLTIIFKAKSIVPLSVTAGSGFVGLRSPKHPIARLLLEASGLPIAAPSANRFGHVSPTSSDHVMQDLGDEVVTILKDNIPLSGGCVVGIESTVCRVNKDGDIVSILRCGAVTSEDIATALEGASHPGLSNVKVIIENEKALIKKVPIVISSQDVTSSTSSGTTTVITDISKDSTTTVSESDESPAVAPGQMMKHYAPDIPTYIVTAESSSSVSPRSVLSFSFSSVQSEGDDNITITEAFVIDFGGQLLHMKDKCSVYCDLSPEGKAEEACNRIFEILRRAEDPALAIPKGIQGLAGEGSGLGVKLVLLPDLRLAAEKNEMVRALWERLHRAASGTFLY